MFRNPRTLRVVPLTIFFIIRIRMMNLMRNRKFKGVRMGNLFNSKVGKRRERLLGRLIFGMKVISLWTCCRDLSLVVFLVSRAILFSVRDWNIADVYPVSTLMLLRENVNPVKTPHISKPMPPVKSLLKMKLLFRNLNKIKVIYWPEQHSCLPKEVLMVKQGILKGI